MLLILILVVLLGFVALWFVVTYNQFIREKNLISEAWSGIDVQLKRRYDLIPNLIETVKGYMQHERKLFEEIANLRAKSLSSESIREKAGAEDALTRTLKTLFAVAEAYPELKANQNFLDLQKSLTDIEAEIQLSRRYYNGTVRNFNIRVESFPSSIVAKKFGFTKREFFEIEDAAQRKKPEVKF